MTGGMIINGRIFSLIELTFCFSIWKCQDQQEWQLLKICKQDKIILYNLLTFKTRNSLTFNWFTLKDLGHHALISKVSRKKLKCWYMTFKTVFFISFLFDNDKLIYYYTSIICLSTSVDNGFLRMSFSNRHYLYNIYHCYIYGYCE